MTAGAVKNSLVIRKKEECKWDLVSLGEVMLRLDPGDVRVATTRQFNVWEGGGEYNVARGLRRCFGLKTAIVTALADNPVGRLLEDLMLQGGVDQSHLVWTKYDGVGRTTRNGLNFTERGFGVRAALGCSDRGNTAVSQLKPGQIDWDEIFGKEGSRWFHTGGIFCALSESTPEVAKEAIASASASALSTDSARNTGTSPISFNDFNTAIFSIISPVLYLIGRLSLDASAAALHHALHLIERSHRRIARRSHRQRTMRTSAVHGPIRTLFVQKSIDQS